MAKPTTGKRKRRRIPADTWDTANAKDFRRLNKPTYLTPPAYLPDPFRPNVRLDPSQVIDNRGHNLIRDIWQWFTNQPVFNDLKPGRTNPANPPQPMPGPRPSPAPSKITNPGLLSKYRR